MQKLIAKYGLAAHLALLAVAPLFLFPFVGAAEVSVVLFWLSLVSLLWMVLAPSVLRGEGITEARVRVLRGVFRDPLFWALVVVVGVCGIRACNDGIALSYDSEKGAWFMSDAAIPFLPGAVSGSGLLPFAAALSASVVIVGCRHALGRAGRMSVLLLASSLAGLSAVLVHVLFAFDFAGVRSFIAFQDGAFSYAGLVYGVYFLAGLVSLFSVVENQWNPVLLLPIFGVGGTGAGLFSFSPSYASAGFLVVAFIVLVYSSFCSGKLLQLSSKLKMGLVGVAAFLLGGLLVAVFLPEKTLAARLAPFKDLAFFPEDFWDVRHVLSGMALKTWTTHLWTGSGLGSFPIDFRFNASAADWTLMPNGALAVPNGWWLLLAERGVVGIVFFVLPVLFLFFTYVRRLVVGIHDVAQWHPACLLTPLAVALLVAAGFVDCSFVRPEVLAASGVVLSVSAMSFPRKRD